MGTQRRINGYLIALFVVILLCIAGIVMLVRPQSTVSSGYLPKDVPYTPPASPLTSPQAQPAMQSDVVAINFPTGGAVGPNTDVTGTATSLDGTVYYRISDFRSGQIASGQVTVPSGNPQAFTFKPEFTRAYTKGDPATLDVYVLDANGAEQTTRLTVTLQ